MPKSVNIVPIIKCKCIKASVHFYTETLDFILTEGPSLSDPGFAVLQRDGSQVHLSSHQGDGTYGNALAIFIKDADPLFKFFVKRGLKPYKPDSPVHQGPTNQTWGTREFYVDDPDNNTLRFIQPYS